MTNDSQTAFLNPCVKFNYEDLKIATGETSRAIIPFTYLGDLYSTNKFLVASEVKTFHPKHGGTRLHQLVRAL